MNDSATHSTNIFDQCYNPYAIDKLVGQTLYRLGSGDSNMQSPFQRQERWWITLWWEEAHVVISIITSSGQAMSDYWAYGDVPKEKIDALNIKEASEEIKQRALSWLNSRVAARAGIKDAKLTFKPQYVNCVCLVFEDHNYYDDSDSWTVYYNGNTHEIVEESWTTRGACQSVNANPQDIQYSIYDCPDNLKKEIVELLRADVISNMTEEELAKMAFELYRPKYKYQEESARKCCEEFIKAAPEVLANINDLWLLCKISNKVHTYTDFDYKFKENCKEQPLNLQIAAKVKSTIAPERKRAKAVYGTRYNGIVQSCKFYASNGFNQLYDATVILVAVPGIEKPVYLRLNGKKEYDAGTEISFAGILGKAGDKYQFIDKARIINEGDKLSWH